MAPSLLTISDAHLSQLSLELADIIRTSTEEQLKTMTVEDDFLCVLNELTRRERLRERAA